MARDFYFSYEGKSYARIDFRQDSNTNNIYLIDYNPYCTIFLKGDICSADKSIKLFGWSKAQFMSFLLCDAFERSQKFLNTHKYEFLWNKGILVAK